MSSYSPSLDITGIDTCIIGRFRDLCYDLGYFISDDQVKEAVKVLDSSGSLYCTVVYVINREPDPV